MKKERKLKDLNEFQSWAKESAFVYPSSEIYGGFAAVYDYGPYGSILLKNIRDAWWKSMVQERDDVVGLDSGIFMHPTTWLASGHVGGFADVLVEDKKTNIRYRADHLIEKFFAEKGETVDMDKKTPEELQQIIEENDIKSPDGNELAAPRSFNLLVKSNLGSTDASFDEKNVTYLRGETCQGIYLNFKNIISTTRKKLPMGIAQIGKAFRNEIVARQFIFRTREFEQMEMQYFHHPDDTEKKYEEWKKDRMKWHTDVLGIPEDSLRFKEHAKLIFYATAAFDIQYKFNSMGDAFDELEGIHARSNYDLTQHAKHSGEKMEYFDQSRNEKYIPHIMETSVGLNRIFMMLLDDAWTEEQIENAKGETDTRIVLKIKKSLAPIKAAILPLMRKPDFQSKALDLKKSLQSEFMVEYDETASIGKRYRRQDEIGTPYCITVDHQTLEDNSVTVRDRDSMKQIRINSDEVMDYIKENL
ncbi:glycine--tRNA ligase [Candidatus Dojkabacteria bacterium]|nr:glycine--tRNA ligase [Candidatus Dojkabacteria bacterium]